MVDTEQVQNRVQVPPRKASKKTATKASAAPKPATAADTPPPMGGFAVIYNTKKSPAAPAGWDLALGLGGLLL